MYALLYALLYLNNPNPTKKNKNVLYVTTDVFSLEIVFSSTATAGTQYYYYFDGFRGAKCALTMTIRHLSGKKYKLYHLLACLGHRTVEVVAARAAKRRYYLRSPHIYYNN
jgi:hypothetical protein